MHIFPLVFPEGVSRDDVRKIHYSLIRRQSCLFDAALLEVASQLEDRLRLRKLQIYLHFRSVCTNFAPYYK